MSRVAVAVGGTVCDPTKAQVKVSSHRYGRSMRWVQEHARVREIFITKKCLPSTHLHGKPAFSLRPRRVRIPARVATIQHRTRFHPAMHYPFAPASRVQPQFPSQRERHRSDLAPLRRGWGGFVEVIFLPPKFSYPSPPATAPGGVGGKQQRDGRKMRGRMMLRAGLRQTAESAMRFAFRAMERGAGVASLMPMAFSATA